MLIKSTVVPNLLDSLVPEKEFWNSSKTLSFLAESCYFKNDEGELEWPDTLKEMRDEGNKSS